MQTTCTRGWNVPTKELVTEKQVFAPVSLDMMGYLAKDLFAPMIAANMELAGLRSILPPKLVAYIRNLGMQ